MNLIFEPIKKYNITFLYIILSVMAISFVFDMTLYGQMYPETAHFVRRILKVLRFVLILYFICSLNFKKSFGRKLLLFICFIALCFLSNRYIRNWNIFDIFFVPLFLSELINRQRLANTVFSTVIFSVLSVIVLHYLNLLPNSVFYRSPDKIRYALGFLHPNLLGFSLVFICIMFLLKNRRLDKIGVALFIALSCFCYFIPNSNSSCFIILLLIILGIISNYLKAMNLTGGQNRTLFVISSSFVLFTILSSYFIIYSEVFKDYIISLPGELWARFSLAKDALDKYEITLFGTPIEVTQNFTVDFAYTFIPICYGISGFVLFLTFFIYSIRKAVYKYSYELLAIFILMTIYGISETVIFTPLFMFVFLCAYAEDVPNGISSE